MSNNPSFFDKLKSTFSNLFGGSPPSPEPAATPKPSQPAATPKPSQPAATPKPSQPDAAPKPSQPAVTLTALEVIAVIRNFAREQCGGNYQPQVKVESLFTIGPTTEQSGSRQMVEWFMCNRPGLALMIMPEPGSCNVILGHSPNPPNPEGYLLGLSPVESQKVPGTVGALRTLLEDYVKEGKIAWRDGKWHYSSGR
jgi:hypothetical protein